MSHIKYLFFLILAGSIVSCEFLESPDGTANVSEGFITFPSITINGDQFITIVAGTPFEDPGAVAMLGTEDITDRMEVSDVVDFNTPGVYILDYSVSVINELDEQSSVTQTRYVAVISESVNGIDFSGQYNGDGTAVSGAWTQAATVTPFTGAFYNIDKALASGNNLGVFFAVVGGESGEQPGKVVVPRQPSVFGQVNTSEGQLNENGFEWTIALQLFGNFGPIIFSR